MPVYEVATLIDTYNHGPAMGGRGPVGNIYVRRWTPAKAWSLWASLTVSHHKPMPTVGASEFSFTRE